MYKFTFKYIISIAFLCIATMGMSQNIFYYSDDFESVLNNKDYVQYHQHLSENYFWHPGINGINKLKSDESKDGLNFNLNADIFRNALNISIGINPTLSYKGLCFGVKLPYNLRYPQEINKLSDLLITTGYKLKVGNFSNNTSVSLNVPLGKTYPIYDFFYGYRLGINGSGSYDFIFSNKFILDKESYGFYGNLIFRESLQNSKTFLIQDLNNVLIRTKDYTFKHGFVSALSLGGYVAPIKNLHIHYGLGYFRNYFNRYTITTTYPDDENIDKKNVPEGTQDYTFIDLRLGLTTRIKSVDFSLFVSNSNDYPGYSYSKSKLNVIFNICYHVF